MNNQLSKYDTDQTIRDRISLLDEEMTANEEENRFMQKEIDELYDKLDVIKEQK